MIGSRFVHQQIQIILFSFTVSISLIMIEHQHRTQHYIPPVHIPVTRFATAYQPYIDKTLKDFGSYRFCIFPNCFQMSMRMPYQIIESKIIRHCRMHYQIIMYLFVIIIAANTSRFPTTDTATRLFRVQNRIHIIRPYQPHIKYICGKTGKLLFSCHPRNKSGIFC